jgi:hypothetical protein
VKEIDDEETSTDSEKVQRSVKVKTGSSSKGGSEAKSGKKRRRVWSLRSLLNRRLLQAELFLVPNTWTLIA